MYSGTLSAGGDGIMCRWTGKHECWDASYTFEECCDTKKGATGDKSCWGKRHNFVSCQCAGPPRNCSGVWDQCSANCTQHFWITQPAVSGGKACEAAHGASRHCEPGQGLCHTSGLNCTQTIVAPKNGGLGTCTGKLAHGEGCRLTCDKDFVMEGHHPKCSNGAIAGGITCQWQGR